jgi:DNA polymerase III subunit gamma/tau
VSAVLGLVRRDLLLDMADAVAREDGPAIFELAAHAVESGYDLRLVVRELARLTRDLLVVTVDPSRASDPEIAAEGERERLQAVAAKFSPEDLMRAFDVLTKAEAEIRASMQPRYHLEMALLRWIHLRRLVPLSDLIQNLDKGAPPGSPARGAAPQAAPAPRPAGNAATVRAVEARKETARPNLPAVAPRADGTAAAAPASPPATDLKDAFLAEVRKAKKFFYGTVIAQAQRIDVEPSRIVLAFSPQHRALRLQVDQTRPVLEEIATRLAGRQMSVVGVEGGGTAPRSNGDHAPPPPDRQAELRQQALSDAGVQAMLDVFAAEIKEVEEM